MRACSAESLPPVPSAQASRLPSAFLPREAWSTGSSRGTSARSRAPYPAPRRGSGTPPAIRGKTRAGFLMRRPPFPKRTQAFPRSAAPFRTARRSFPIPRRAFPEPCPEFPAEEQRGVAADGRMRRELERRQHQPNRKKAQRHSERSPDAPLTCSASLGTRCGARGGTQVRKLRPPGGPRPGARAAGRNFPIEVGLVIA